MFTKAAIKKFVINALIVYFSVALGLFLIQRSMMYYPTKTPPSLSEYRGEGVMQEVKVTTDDGLTINGWYKPAEKGKPTILWFHGNAGNHGMRFPLAYLYAHKGYGLLLAGYRGFGGNEGKPTEKGLYKDARAWITSLTGAGVDIGDIVLYGESLGSGVAVQMATEFKDIHALILQAPYLSFVVIARKRYFFLPVDLMLLDQYRSKDKIADVTAPLLIMHGEQDSLIPATHGRKLYELATTDVKEIEIFSAVGHNDLPMPMLAARAMGFLEGL